MSEPTPEPQDQPAPEPQNPPTPEPATPPTPEPPNPGNGDTGRLSALEDMVKSLVNTVTDLTKNASAAKPNDTRPVRKPWTHWGGTR